MSRDALLQEVSYLSSRNAQLEEELAISPRINDKYDELRKENEVLLTLLGEKEEELESCITDMKDIKNMYKAQIEELMDRVAPPSTHIHNISPPTSHHKKMATPKGSKIK